VTIFVVFLGILIQIWNKNPSPIGANQITTHLVILVS